MSLPPRLPGFLLLFLLTSVPGRAQDTSKALRLSFTPGNGSFLLAGKGARTLLVLDSTEASVVKIAAGCFQRDVEAVTGSKPVMDYVKRETTGPGIMVGTLGHSVWIDRFIKESKINIAGLRGKWEGFLVVAAAQPGKPQAPVLCVIGADARGTAFGIFELSKMIGVSPWYWWADVVPEKHAAIYVVKGKPILQSPSVQYRGIFINDEDWGMQPWAARKMDTAFHDIGPNTYAHIFELLLRLKANYIWPAMHPCTKAFYYYKENARVADQYGIVVGTSHCEPMLRNNVFEWAENYPQEYGIKPGEWRYDVNKQQIYPYWEDRIREVKNYESVVTVGMRGIHDGGMPGPKDIQGKVKLLENVILDQREILQKYYKKPISEIPQIFCPYKEVLQLYRAGMKLPEDVTIAWADDNHGYITQLDEQAEQKRTGGSGVYYHLSYWGAPQDYLWLSTISPSLISYEMSKAYAFNAKRLWVFNVGDLKPAEMELNFALDLAWNVDEWAPARAYAYTENWLGSIFGNELAKPLAAIKNAYFRLSNAGKPEHLGQLRYSQVKAEQRLRDYAGLADQTDTLAAKIPARLKDAYYELIQYPVKGAALMNQKILFARKSLVLAASGDVSAKEYSKKAASAFKEIQRLTTFYNKEMAGGKWDGIMDWQPRRLEVFSMPPTAEMDSSKRTVAINTLFPADTGVAEIPASSFTTHQDAGGTTITALAGLGYAGSGITRMPFTANVFPASLLQQAPFVEYQLQLQPGKHKVLVKCLPTQNINKTTPAEYAISVNGDMPQMINISSDKNDWSRNVLYGYSVGRSVHQVTSPGLSTIRIYLPSPGVVINAIEIL